MEAPFCAVIKAAAASIVALGAIDSLAGATPYTLTTLPPSHPSPYTVTEGSQIEAVAFALSPATTAAPGSWVVGGSFPPGLSFGQTQPALNVITSVGTLTGNVVNPVLFGTPTTPGDYVMTIQAVEASGAADGKMASTNVFNYEVVVVSNAPTPTPTPISGAPPVFTEQPISATVTGGTVALEVAATNSPTYQWSLNEVQIPGATSSILLIPNAASGVGSYTCTANNSAGAATSNAATVSLSSTTSTGRLINISCRATVGTGQNILIPGLVIGGSGTEILLIRADGPALIPFGVSGVLAQPSLSVYSGSTVVASNTVWGTNSNPSQIASIAAQVGAFPLASNSADCALIANLGPGAYTVQVSGVGSTTGVALAEVYEVSSTGTRLINLSTRAQVGTGGNILISGFVVGGATSMTVLTRASGPAIEAAPFNVPGTLPDPKLQLYTGSSALLASDDGWGGNPQIASEAASVGAFSWGVSATPDSALLGTLPPGAYTAQVSGAGGDTGVALIEVYYVP